MCFQGALLIWDRLTRAFAHMVYTGCLEVFLHTRWCTGCVFLGGFSSLEQFTAGKREFHSPWSTEKNAKCEPQEKHSLGSGVGAEQQVTGPGAPWTIVPPTVVSSSSYQEFQVNERGCGRLRRESLSDSTEPLALFSADKLFLEIKDGLCMRKVVVGCFRNKTEESEVCWENGSVCIREAKVHHG